MFDDLLKYDLGAGVEAFSARRNAELPYPVIQGRQVHGCKVAVVDRPGMTREELDGYDAFVTRLPGVAVGVRTADCVPVLLYDPVKRVVAAVHAGWKGTVLHISRKAVGVMARQFGCEPGDLRAVIGPGIGPDSFQVGEEVAGHFKDAGFPVELVWSFRGPEDGTPFEKTNASKSYAFLLAEGYKADYQVNAVSGRGLVRNYANIVPEWTLENLYEYTMMGAPEQEKDAERWNFEKFHPQVVVVFVGINDFQGEPPYADVGKFKEAYAKLLDKLRALHPGVKFLLVATKTWPNDDLGGVVESIYNDQVAAGKNDIVYKFVYTENTALHGHPSEMSQKELANTLRPLVGRLGGWLSR